MKGKKHEKEEKRETNTENVYIEEMGQTKNQNLTETLETNYMPYAMSVILSRAIPEIDGFKPSHRKLLYTMYKMGLLTGSRTKSANVVGQTMRLNPHGDSAIYETMVRLSKGNESLLMPFIDSKGNFGKAYSRDMAYAASRYTEVKLSEVCEYVFEDIDKNTVDFVDNYDSTTKEPVLLPIAFPNILANPNLGIAVGMASNICSFNLRELCTATIELIKNSEYDVANSLIAPDFSTGGQILLDKDAMKKIYETGRGSFKVRAIYNYDNKNNCIDITEIPPTTTIEAIVDKIVECVKTGKLKEISDVRDETDLGGLKLTIDLKRGIDHTKLMKKLFRLTPLEDSFSCNFNVLVGTEPKVLGVPEIIKYWLTFRRECVKRSLQFDLEKKSTKLNLLKGLEKILLDIDKAIKVIRETANDADVVPNLMQAFELDKAQAEFVAEIKLRNLNREYILKKTQEIDSLEKEINWVKESLGSDKAIGEIIIKKLEEIAKKYGKERQTSFILCDGLEEQQEQEDVPNYPVHIFVTKEGYIKKITTQSLRMSSEQKLKPGDKIAADIKTTNNSELLIFTNFAQVYKLKCNDLDDTRASTFGEFLPAKLLMDENELPLFVTATLDYSGDLIIAFKNGKFARVALECYKTTTNRKKLIKAYNSDSTPVFMMQIKEDINLVVTSAQKRILAFNTSLLHTKVTKDTQGVLVMKLKKGDKLVKVKTEEQARLKNISEYIVTNIPRAGILKEASQLSMNL